MTRRAVRNERDFRRLIAQAMAVGLLAKPTLVEEFLITPEENGRVIIRAVKRRLRLLLREG